MGLVLRVFSLLGLHHRLSTSDRLSRWGVACNPICVLCGSDPESVQHLFFQCSFSNSVWRSALIRLQVPRQVCNFDEVIQMVAAAARRSDDKNCLLCSSQSQFMQFGLLETLRFSMALVSWLVICLARFVFIWLVDVRILVSCWCS